MNGLRRFKTTHYWTHIQVHPARGKGPLTTVAGFLGAVGAGVGCLWLAGRHMPYNPSAAQWAVLVAVGIAGFLAANVLIHRPYLVGYRKTVAAPNAFDVGPAGLRIEGQVLPRPRLIQFTARNPYSHQSQSTSVSAVAMGTGTQGTAMAAGSVVGNTVAQAAALQHSHLLARLAAHGWMLEVLDIQGTAHRLAGGLTENTLNALLATLHQRLGD